MKPTTLLVLATALSPLQAWACRCVEPTVDRAYARADAVARVQVNQIVTLADGSTRIEAQALESWKSDVPRALRIATGPDNCAYTPTAGETHLLFLQRGEQGELTTARCDGNQTQAEAADSLRWLTSKGKRSSMIAENSTMIQTEAAAVAAAKEAWRAAKFEISPYEPYRGTLTDGVWHVYGTLPPGTRGGTPGAEIRASDGAVLKVFHTQ
jgi:hypothetical protein